MIIDGPKILRSHSFRILHICAKLGERLTFWPDHGLHRWSPCGSQIHFWMKIRLWENITHMRFWNSCPLGRSIYLVYLLIIPLKCRLTFSLFFHVLFSLSLQKRLIDRPYLVTASIIVKHSHQLVHSVLFFGDIHLKFLLEMQDLQRFFSTDFWVMGSQGFLVLRHAKILLRNNDWFIGWLYTRFDLQFRLFFDLHLTKFVLLPLFESNWCIINIFGLFNSYFLGIILDAFNLFFELFYLFINVIYCFEPIILYD